MSKQIPLPGFERSISSPGGSRARTSALPGPGSELKVRGAGCGKSSFVSFARYDPGSCSWKMLRCSLFGVFLPYSGTWPKRGMIRSGICLRLRSSGSRTSGRESLYLPTPQASDGKFCMIRRPVKMRRGAYRICSNQGIDGSANLKDIAWNVWGGPLSPRYVEVMMGFPLDWTSVKKDSTPSGTPSCPR